MSIVPSEERPTEDRGSVHEAEALEPEVEDAEHLLAERRQEVAQRVRVHTLPDLVQFLQDPAKGVENLEAYNTLIQALRKFSIRLTYPSDWVLHVVRNEDRTIKVGFLQDVGCERADDPWGIEYLSRPKDSLETLPDGTYVWTWVADAFCRRTGQTYLGAQGSRWSGDTFFRRLKDRAGYLNPLHVKESASRNLHGRIVRTLAGLSAVPEEELRAAGIDTNRCHVVVHRGAREEALPRGEQTRGKGASQELYELVKARAGDQSKVGITLRDLCKAQGWAQKDSVAELTPAQVADLLAVLRREGQAPPERGQDKLL